MMKKLTYIVALVALSVSLSGASCNGGNDASQDVRQKAATAAIIAHEVVQSAWATESALRCGQPIALPEPNCINPELDAKLAAKFEMAHKYDARLQRLTAVLPEGVPSTTETLTIVTQLYDLVQAIIADLPKHEKTEALAQNVKTLGQEIEKEKK